MDRTPDSTTPRAADQENQGTQGELTDEARIFYERLEEAGQLRDIDFDTDTSQLPPSVTHVRYPDGVVRRIGFS